MVTRLTQFSSQPRAGARWSSGVGCDPWAGIQGEDEPPWIPAHRSVGMAGLGKVGLEGGQGVTGDPRRGWIPGTGQCQVWEGKTQGWEAELAPNTPQKQEWGAKYRWGKKMDALGKGLEKEGAAPQVPPHRWEKEEEEDE